MARVHLRPRYPLAARQSVTRVTALGGLSRYGLSVLSRPAPLLLALFSLALLLLSACGSDGEPGDPSERAAPAAASPNPLDDPQAYPFALLWPDTDFAKRTAPLSEIISGGVSPDGIPPLDAEGATSTPSPRAGVARFAPVDEVDYADRLPVAFVRVGDDARAYPLHILIWHEVVNDRVGGEPLVVTFCPLCNTAIAYKRTMADGTVLDFGVSGLLRNSDLIMWDRQTKSWWQQALGEAIVGHYAGTRLEVVPAPIVSFGELRRSFPDALVLTEDTGIDRDYGLNPYEGYDQIGNTPFLYYGQIDPRLPAMERVVALRDGDESLVLPFSALAASRVVQLEFAGEPLVVLWAPGAASALGEGQIADAHDVGSVGVFRARLGGTALSFTARDGGTFVDQEGTIWSVAGRALAGPRAGAQLAVFPHQVPFWFAWAAFFPEAELWRGDR